MRPTSFTIRPSSALIIPANFGIRFLTYEHITWLNKHIGEGVWSSRWEFGLGDRNSEGLVITFLYPDDAMRYKLTFGEEFR